jgi:geranylgeranyl diphosphate synthase type II
MQEQMNPFAGVIESALLAACAPLADVSNGCLEAIRTHLAAGGGRVRARICLDAGLALDLSEEDAVRIAVACELLHNASLVQDDLLDRSTERRGAACIWLTHGDSVAVCAGDLMLSAAYGLLAELSDLRLIAPAIRLVHRRTSEVILGQAEEGIPKSEQEATFAYYDRLAKGKSASLLSLALELPLLLSGNEALQPVAHSAMCDFAIAYQIADDLADLDQDMQEGSLNLARMLMEQEGLTRDKAQDKAAGIAEAKLASANAYALRLPNHCAATMLRHAETLRHSLATAIVPSLSTAESGR